jgi:hypothetical protein
MRTKRGEVRTLKQAVAQQGSVQAMFALLNRSVKLGHRRLALLRYLQAEWMVIVIRPASLAYCERVADQMPFAELERIAAPVQRDAKL